MSSEPGSVHAEQASKVYEGERRGLRLRDALPGVGLRPRRPVIALDEVDLHVRPGERVGFIGPNGAGKSTLLKLVAGVTTASSGTVRTVGRVGSMIELGLGFHEELTGWDNIRCAAVVLGLTSAEARSAAPAIAEFSGIEHALDDPIRTYSTGMRARLGFAVTTQVHADVLVVDEVLAVGDSAFQLKCLARIQELADAGTTVLFVSHDMTLVRLVCERAVCLRGGRLVDDGDASEVVKRYLRRSTDQYRVAADASLRFESIGLAPAEIETCDPVRVEAVVEVRQPLRGVDVAVELSRPAVRDEPPFTFDTASLPALREPGRYRLAGASKPYPGGSGSTAVTVSLLDAGRHEVCDRAELEVQVPGPPQPQHTHLEVDPIVAVRAAHAPTGTAPRPEERWADRPVVATVRGAVKRFASDGLGARARLAVPGAIGRGADDHVAVDGIDLDVHGGTALGVIGTNGAGKSTLLRLLAGVSQPEEGVVTTTGRVVPILDLGLGFRDDLTGRENLEASAGLLGLTRDDLQDRLDDILEFAGLPDVLDQLVQHYSTGMRARLGFALAAHTEPDLLLIDELLSVGDRDFRQLALDRIRSLRDGGAAVVVVSHGLQLIEELCDRAVRVEAGRIVDDGFAADVVERYGGASLIAGASDAGASVRIHDLRLRRSHIGEGETVELRATVQVSAPSPSVRIEATYRSSPEDRDEPMPWEEIVRRTFLRRTVLPSGAELEVPGWYDLEIEVPRTEVSGAFDVSLLAFDERDQIVLSESWQQITVGDRPELGWRCRFSWSVEPITATERRAT